LRIFLRRKQINIFYKTCNNKPVMPVQTVTDHLQKLRKFHLNILNLFVQMHIGRIVPMVLKTTGTVCPNGSDKLSG